MFVKVVSEIEAGGLDDWPEPDLREALTSLEAARARVDAAQAHVLAAFVRRGRAPEAFFGSLLSVRDASRRTKAAVALFDGSLPGWVEALAAGAVTFDHVLSVVDALDDLPEGATSTLLPEAKKLAPDKFRRRVRRRAVPRDRVAEGSLTKLADGGLRLRCEYNRYDGEVVLTAFTKVIDQQWRTEHPDRGDTKSELPPYEQRVAQALLEMCRRIVNGQPTAEAEDDDTDAVHGDIDAAGGTDAVHGDESSVRKASGWTTPTPEAFVIIPFARLLGDAEEAGVPTTLEGDPLPPDVIRKMLVHATIYPVVLGGDGEVLDFGRGKRLFTATQRKAMAVRDGSCQFADCDTPIRYTQAHHTDPWAQGGLTDLRDGVPVCHCDHAKLTDRGYRIERHNGHTYTYAPDGTLIYKRDNRWRT